MRDVIIPIGQHRNERTACYFGPLLVENLSDLGYNADLVENPERRTLMEIVFEASKKGRKINKIEMREILYAWEDYIMAKAYSDSYVLALHNWLTNPTPFMAQMNMPAEKAAITLTNWFSDFDLLKGNPFADMVYFDVLTSFCGDHAIIEIPHVLMDTFKQDELESARKVLYESVPGKWDCYLLDTNIKKTAEKGWLGSELLDVLTRGIDYLLKRGFDRFVIK